MSEALKREGIEVCEIENGGILLPPHEYGFIGGAAGVYRNTVYFLGDVKKHKSAQKILDTCERAGFEAVSLSGEELADLGRIIFID